MRAKTHAIFKKTSVFLFAALAILLTVRWIIPLFWPFILAFGIALLLDRPVELLSKKTGMKRAFSSAVVVTLFLAFFVFCIIFTITRIGSALNIYLRDAPEKFGQLQEKTQQLGRNIESFVATLPQDLSVLLSSLAASLRQQLFSLSSEIYSSLFSMLSTAVSRMPAIVFSAFISALALYFISSGLPAIKNFLLRQLPQSLSDRAGAIKREIISTVRGWAGAQLKLMLICFAELLAVFLIMRVKNVFLLAAAVAIIDSLPVFGVGIILLPWACAALLMGNYRRAFFLVLAYGGINLVRSSLEPRLLGKQTGLHPAATLIAVYGGYRLAGILGMLVFPIFLMLLNQFHNRGWIKLWR